MKKTGIIVGLIVLLGLGGIAGGYYYFVQRPNITVGDDGIIFIQPGDSFETVMTTLISSGYVKNEYSLPVSCSSTFWKISSCFRSSAAAIFCSVSDASEAVK